MANVTRIDVARRRIVMEQGETTYDSLIVATGMTHAYFGYDRWAAHAPGLKTVGEALDIRRRILRAFENAELASSPEERRAWTTFVVIGGGPTGVELGGAIAEIAGRTLARDFRHFDPRTTRVILVEAGSRILSTFAPELSESAQRQLSHLGVEVRTGSAVSDLGSDFVDVGNERIDTRTVIWAAGVKGQCLPGLEAAFNDKANRLNVDAFNRVEGTANIHAIGDVALILDWF